MSQSDLAKILAGKHALGMKACVRVAELTQVPLLDVIALTQEDVAKTPKNKAFWSRRSPRISAATALAAVALIAAGARTDAKASSTVQNTSRDLTTYTLCEHRM